MRIWTHSQNLNDHGSRLRHGRAFLHWGEACWHFEWTFGGGFRWLGAEVNIGGCDNDYSLSLGFLFGGLYFGVERLRAFGALQRDWPRQTGISLHGDRLRMSWNCDDSSWSAKTGPAHGWEKGWNLLDILLGPNRYSQGCATETIETAVQMPERAYPCTVSLHTDSWKRPRWPFTKRIQRANIDIPNGVPFPGKGENSWDCGEDATFGMTCPAASVDEALHALRTSVLRSRERYGGRNWVPSN